MPPFGVVEQAVRAKVMNSELIERDMRPPVFVFSLGERGEALFAYSYYFVFWELVFNGVVVRLFVVAILMGGG